MRFALLGNHPDALALARALVDSGRHEVVGFTSPVPFDVNRRQAVRLGTAERGLRLADSALATRPSHPQSRSDLEEILADPSIEAIIVAGRLEDRPALLRRALQSERHVLCVHPADQTPEIGYEAGMICKDVRRVLLPLLPEALHPAVRRLAEFTRPIVDSSVQFAIGAFRLLEVERAATGDVLGIPGGAGAKPCFPGWDILRRLGGEIAEVSTFAASEEPDASDPVLIAGRFESGGLFQMTLLPDQPEDRWRLTAVGDCGRAELLFLLGWNGPAQLGWRDAGGEYHEEFWDRWDPWPTVIQAGELRIADCGLRIEEQTANRNPQSAVVIDWQDEIRALELDDAARRSLEKRRTSPLEYPQDSEEVGFKGTMTLVGCGVLWLVLGLLIASRWVPVVGWLILPLLAVFLGLQFLRYAVPAQNRDH